MNKDTKEILEILERMKKDISVIEQAIRDDYHNSAVIDFYANDVFTPPVAACNDWSLKNFENWSDNITNLI